MRKRVYPKWVESGRMTQDVADHEIAVMAEIVQDYYEKMQPSLFYEEDDL